MKASFGKSPSLTWRSICWDRELFKRGYRWRIGNRKQIRIDRDPWINRKGNARLVLVKENLKGHKVSHLLDNDNHWKKDIIRQRFSNHDIEDIMNMPTGSKDTNNEVIWNLDKKGLFSVKSV